MQSQSLDATVTPAVDLILEAYNHADVGKYAEALAKIKAAKAADPRNIYVIALEKQFAKLLSLSPGASFEEAREKLPGLLDRALDSARKNQGAAQAPAVSSEQESEEEKEARLKEVRDHYFTRADEFMERGDYESALAEVRRVTIIDPENRIARQYEEKIALLTGTQIPEKPAGTAEHQDAKKPSPTPAAPAKEPQHSSPGHPLGQLPEGVVAPPTEKKKGMSRGMIIMMVGTIVAVGLGAAFFFTRGPGHANARLVYSLGDAQKIVMAETQVIQVTPVQETAAPQQTQTSESASPSSTVAEEPKATAKESKQASVKTPQATPPKQESKPETTTKAAPPQQSQPLASNATPAPATKEPESTSSAPPSQPFVAVEKEPKIVKLQAPKLPESAIRAGLTGRVIVKVLIDEQGKPSQAVILTSSNHVFDECVVNAVMSSKFEPGMMSSGPVQTWMSIPFIFK